MARFDILLLLNAILAVVALARSRGATLIIIANVCAVLRAFAGIDEFGQPRSQWFSPPVIFDPSRLDTALNIFIFVTFAGALAVVAPEAPPDPPGTPKPVLPVLPRWLNVLLGLYVVTFVLSSKSIISGTYFDPSREYFAVPHGGEGFLLQSLIVYELYRRVGLGLLKARTGFLLLIVMLFFTDYSKGSTGGATGFVFMAAFLMVGHGQGAMKKPLKIAAVLSAAVLLAIAVRTVRATLYTEGAEALETATHSVINTEETRGRGAEGVENFANGTQSATHVLECIYLWESGYSRQWRSLYEPIIYTFQPKYFMDLLGWERRIEPAWELGRYFIHGGGISIFGEMYWNGGYLCVVLGTLLVFFVAYMGDTRRDKSFGWLIFYCNFASCLGYGVGYGLTYLFRGTSNALIIIVLHNMFRRVWSAKRAEIARSGAEVRSRLLGQARGGA